ncbi:MAG TPA: hypothetical protein VNO75_06870 [Gemmatimonadaceae bacterium]|nr:hypothetical protein [Gemmatimonadaceae bacterium]
MKITVALAALLSLASGLGAQVGPASPRDSAARADSIARADSLALVRELEALERGGRDTTSVAALTPGQGPINPRLMPDISVIGDVVADLSPSGSTLEGGRRFDIREVELALGAAVDPYFRADFIFGVSDLEGIAVEEAYVTATALPWSLLAKVGRFHMPIGKQNTTHRPELQTVEYPHVIQRFLGPEGGKGTGLWFSRIFAPFGFYQELQATAVDHLGEAEEDEELETLEPSNRSLGGLGYSARLRNYWDMSEASNLELSASAATSRRAQPVLCGGVPVCPGIDGTPGVNARQSLVGADLTFRWRPLQQGLYKSFIAQAEYLRQLNQNDPALPPAFGAAAEYIGPSRNLDGGYAFARYQLTRRTHIGGRFDWVEEEDAAGEKANATAFSAYLQFFPSEFSKLVGAYERFIPPGQAERTNRILLQMTFSIGPHRPHPF